jgi:cobyrinic acid a,c-diamide synthase
MPGGYPELHAGKLATAENCFSAIRDHAQTRSVHGECGGYMVLGSHLIDKEGTSHKMIGVLGLVTSYAKRKFNLGYRLAETNSPIEIFSVNKKLRGHEFHYSSIIEQPDEPLFSVKDAEGNAVSETGSVRGKVSGTFFHMIAEAD